MMNCEVFEKNLSALIDGELLPQESESMHMHMQDCANCRGLFEGVRKNIEALSSIAQENVPEGFAGQVMNALPKKEGQKPVIRKAARILAPLAAAVVIFVAGYNILNSNLYAPESEAVEFAAAEQASVVNEAVPEDALEPQKESAQKKQSAPKANSISEDMAPIEDAAMPKSAGGVLADGAPASETPGLEIYAPEAAGFEASAQDEVMDEAGSSNDPISGKKETEDGYICYTKDKKAVYKSLKKLLDDIGATYTETGQYSLSISDTGGKDGKIIDWLNSKGSFDYNKKTLAKGIRLTIK